MKGKRCVIFPVEVQGAIEIKNHEKFNYQKLRDDLEPSRTSKVKLFLLKQLTTKTPLTTFTKKLHHRCLTEFLIRLWRPTKYWKAMK